MSRQRLRAIAAALLVALAGLRPAQAQDPRVPELTELFSKAKAQFRGGGYDASLVTLQKLDEASRAPGLEAAREKLAPAVAFYRGAALAALGHRAEAKKEFEIYLASSPPLKLDPSMYPKPVLDVYGEARDELRSRAGGPPASDAGLAEAYARFRADPAAPGMAIDEKWGGGAVRFLMTKAEQADWRRLTDAAARAEFVVLFWQRRDATPETPGNEYREEIERRIQFADSRFAQGEKKGSVTDRGMVFVLMGPPSYIGQAILKSEDDPILVARAAPGQELVKDVNGRVTQQAVSREAMTAERIQGTREAWHYRRDRLPTTVRFNELDFEFITKEGYGVAVLQREPDVLTALELAGRPATASRP